MLVICEFTFFEVQNDAQNNTKIKAAHLPESYFCFPVFVSANMYLKRMDKYFRFRLHEK